MRVEICTILPLLFVACAPQKPDPKNTNHDGSAPVLILNDERVSLNEFERRIQKLPDFAASKLSTVEAKRAHLKGVAQFEVLAQHAIKEGFDRDPEVVSALKVALQATHLDPKNGVTSDEIDEEVERRKTEIRYGLKVDASDCSVDETISALPAEQRLSKLASFKGAVSFSTRQKGDDQKELLKLQKVGDYTLAKNHDQDCSFLVLTKIVPKIPERLLIESQLRASKKARFLDTLEK